MYPTSAFTALRIPSKTRGRESVNCETFAAKSEAFSCRGGCSISQQARWWYVVFRNLMIPSNAIRQRKSPDLNWHLRSVVIVEGQHKHATYHSTEAQAIVSTVVLLMRTPSDQRIERSTRKEVRVCI